MPADRTTENTDWASGPPLVVTLMLDDVAQAHFDALRTRYFPPERLLVGAHVTMFHAIPPDLEPKLLMATQEACARVQQFKVGIVGTRLLGRGVAYTLATPEAVALRAHLAAQFTGRLTPQDNSRWSPHITIQNKVSPLIARETQAALADLSAMGPIIARGVALWRYKGGPWEKLAAYYFAGENQRSIA